jgi:hypothetical protein
MALVQKKIVSSGYLFRKMKKDLSKLTFYKVHFAPRRCTVWIISLPTEY